MAIEPAPDLSRLPPPRLVEDAETLARLVERLEREREIAVDTEADSFFHYREKVCLIQITTGEDDWLVDPLGPFDIDPLGRVFADPDRIKVFHDGEYDLSILKREFDFRFAGLFDTRLAESALGQPSPGLASVLKERFGVELDKSMQRSDWSQRPLSEKQISYARLDTRFLVPLMHRQRAELTERGRLEIVEGECLRLEALEPVDRPFNPDEFVRLKGARDLSKESLQLLRELFVLRDEVARERDLPPFKVLANPVLVEIAQAFPRGRDALYGLRGVSARQLRRMERGILRAIDRARELGPLKQLPRLPSKDGTSALDDEQLELHERLRNWRRDAAKEAELDSSLILNRLTMLEIARVRPAAREELAAVDGLLPWQLDAFGEALLAVVARFEEELASGAIEPTRRRSRRG